MKLKEIIWNQRKSGNAKNREIEINREREKEEEAYRKKQISKCKPQRFGQFICPLFEFYHSQNL